MARGLLNGIVMGGVVSLGTIAVVSVLAPPPVPPVVGDAAPDSAGTPRAAGNADKDRAASRADEEPQLGAAAPQSSAPPPDDLAVIGSDTTTTAAQPTTGQAADLSAPAQPDSASGVAVDQEEPVLPNPQALAPMAPQEADDLSVSTEPAQPPLPDAAVPQGAFDTAPGEADGTGDAIEATDAADPADGNAGAEADTGEGSYGAPVPDDVDSAPQTMIVAPEVPEDSAMLSETGQAEAATETAAEAEADDEAEADAPAGPPPAAPEALPAAETETPDAPATEPEAAPAETSPATAQGDATGTGTGAQVTLDEDGAVTRKRIGTPVVPLTERGGGAVVINRPGDGATEDAEVAAEAPDAPQDDALPPIQRYAETTPETEGKPLLGIVLIDDASQPTSGAAGLAALRSFPYPLSFAVDASLPDAAARMALYREAGFEVLAMADLPAGAQPADAETAFNVILPKMDQVVGVLEGAGAGFQGSRALADQVTAILADSGHGLVTRDKGLNTMPNLARKAGVPAAPIFRDFDSKGQSATVIRRFLDQAAFKAGQEGAVIMLGRLRPDTISALLLWGLQDRASTVAMVPVSAVLLRE